MPRSEGSWKDFFKRREAGKASGKRSAQEPAAASTSRRLSILPAARVVGEPPIDSNRVGKSYIALNAKKNRKNPTPAEKEFRRLISSLNDGALRTRFRDQHVISGKWIVDFFFPEVRLAIEIDGSIHQTAKQIEKDLRKDADCKRFDITLIRISNDEVFGDRGALIAKLRDGWRQAKARPNSMIGKRVPL